MIVQDEIHLVSTLLTIGAHADYSYGTGFFYARVKGPGKFIWDNIESMWLVTNRHIALLDDDNTSDPAESVPETLIFWHRETINNHITVEEYTLSRKELYRRLYVHANQEIDLAVVRIDDLIYQKQHHGSKKGKRFLSPFCITKYDFPENTQIPVEVGDDVLVIGYPHGYYDELNKFPIVKSGIIASKWGANFEGDPCFLIDAKLFPGSSGSLVITKPTFINLINGKFGTAPRKVYSFLGTFSGNPIQRTIPIEFNDFTIIRKESYDVGMVWYGNLIDEIIDYGIRFDEVELNTA